jgi:hypothetical protein
LKIEKAFNKLFEEYKPDPICVEGMWAYIRRQPKSSCPHTDKKSKELWEHGWVSTDIGYIKAAQYSKEKYDDPKNWVTKGKMQNLWKKHNENQ